MALITSRYFRVCVEIEGPIAAITLNLSAFVPKRFFALGVFGIVIIAAF